ncbi:TNF receptor-associated factor 2 [Liparis tanakae]|uniref:TNF receptor-associated factor n=1 Tax=Liparis tanakae TaxID=230148 RepID=A0A4Z2I8R1_9TELE|nr:TNF receptor-associated factor 2 [Liparis tanakae]
MARISLDCPNPLPGIPQSVLSVPMENKYKCQQCLQVLRKPVQAQCGHRFCVHCFKLLTSCGPKPCEACRQEEIYEEPFSILNSNEAQHEDRCEFERMPCEACQTSILRTEKERHDERECEARTLNCKYCKTTFNFKEIKAHDEICLKFPLQCKDCGKKKIPREKFTEHSKLCAKSKSACPFSDVGCKYVTDSGKLGDHEHGSTMEHLRLLLPMVLSMSRTRAEAPGQGEWQEDSGLGLYRAPEEGAATETGAAASMQSVDVEKKANQEKIENLSNKVRQLERTVSMRDLQLSETEQLLRELQFCTYDGIFVWKVSDFARRRQDAVAGRTPAMFSPAFYSSKYGYKMCLRLYLNGDGTGRGTHLSLFFVVMRGKCDALLKWPFSQKVTLMLLDQNNREHIIDAFRPDVTSTSFQRPISEMNIASGCPLFCPLAKLAGKSPYLRDDTIFIKAIVDLTGL